MGLNSRAAGVASLTMISTTLALLSVFARLWSRRLTKQTLAANDYMILVAMLLLSGACGIFFTGALRGGEGEHIQNVNPLAIALFLKLFVAGQILWAAANSCVKTSILLLYIKLFPVKTMHICCYTTIGLTWCYFISVFVEAFALCHPVAYSWDPSIPGGYCTNQNLAFLIAGSTNFALDIIVVVLPTPILWSLRLPLKKKIGVVAMFSLGISICAITLLRVCWLRQWDLKDLTYTVTPGAIWSILEPSLGVINANLPVMTPVIRKVLCLPNISETRATGYSSEGFNSHRKWYGKNSLNSNISTNNAKHFQKIEQPEHELTPYSLGAKQTPVLVPSSEFESSRVEAVPLVGDERWEESGAILKTTDWSVQSVHTKEQDESPV